MKQLDSMQKVQYFFQQELMAMKAPVLPPQQGYLLQNQPGLQQTSVSQTPANSGQMWKTILYMHSWCSMFRASLPMLPTYNIGNRTIYTSDLHYLFVDLTETWLKPKHSVRKLKLITTMCKDLIVCTESTGELSSMFTNQLLLHLLIDLMTIFVKQF